MSINPPRYQVRTAIAADGERMPLLIESATGLPVFHPNLYVLVTYRAKGRMKETIKSYLSALAILLEFLESRSIDLVQRLRRGEFLFDFEIDAIVAACRKRKDACQDTGEPSNKVVKLPTTKSALQMSDPSVKHRGVNRRTAATRICECRKYLEWYGKYVTERLVSKSERFAATNAVTNACHLMKAKAPDTKDRNAVHVREGLPPDALRTLQRVLAVGSNENPFKNSFIQVRNQAIVYLLLDLGVRRGELLKIKVHDIDFDRRTVKVMRRPDEVEDPREDEPEVKTTSRELPLNDFSFRLTVEFIAYVRRELNPNHDYLFVARDGAPLDKSSITKIFQAIRRKVPGLPNDTSAHVMRHTWNDLLSEHSDKAGWTDIEERRFREYMMGWRKDSKMAEVYTRRTTRLKAARASLESQDKLYVKPKANEEVADD